ncbi:VWA domain-containing protein [bacterium]|nr:VWA domain-containing protein [bacterium]
MKQSTILQTVLCVMCMLMLPVAASAMLGNDETRADSLKKTDVENAVQTPVGTAAAVELDFKRVSVIWPMVELYFNVRCNGTLQNNIPKSSFKVVEDNLEVPDFTLSCPDTSVRCPMSTAIVLDASGSMSGAGNAGTKAAGRAFIDRMDGVLDEATIIWFNTTVNIAQQMTTLKPLLLSAVDGLPAGGGTAVWDGAYAGVIEIINNGVNQCRSVVVLTDGADNQSTRTPDEIIRLASRNHIRVFTVALTQFMDTSDLQRIAQETGGRFYQTSDPGDLTAMFEEICTIIFEGFHECVITYERDCADGATHSTHLSVDGVCGGSDARLREYQAPMDTTTFETIPIRLDHVVGAQQSSVLVPLRIDQLPSNPLHPVEFTVDYDSSKLTFNGFRTDGYLLDGKMVVETRHGNRVLLHLFVPVELPMSGVLGALSFTTAAVTQEVTTDVTLSDIDFSMGCIKGIPISGSVRIMLGAGPYIEYSGSTELCEGETRQLTAPDGYAGYLWSTSETTRSITVSTTGDYWVEVTDAQGKKDTSNTVSIIVYPIPQPDIYSASGGYQFCAGDSLLLEVAGGPFASYRWSNGKMTQSILVAESGSYFVTVTGAGGCRAVSDTITIEGLEEPHPVISYTGSLPICEGDTVVLDAGAFAAYRWSNNAQSRMITVTQEGSYFARVWTQEGCLGLTDTVQVRVEERPPKPVIEQYGPVLVSSKAVRYQWIKDGRWLSGKTNQYLDELEVGVYQVLVQGPNGCSSISDPFEIKSLGIDRPAYITALDVYPDPNNGFVHVAITSEKAVQWTLTVSNLLGEQLYEHRQSQPSTQLQQQIDMSSFVPGMYLLRVQSGEDSWTRRIMRQ